MNNEQLPSRVERIRRKKQENSAQLVIEILAWIGGVCFIFSMLLTHD